MKNIILLMTDTFRYDNLFDRAARHVNTPELDSFAGERATEVHGMHTGSFPTIPQRTDLAQGRLGWPRFPWQDIRQSGGNTLLATLRNAGYATQLLCDCPHLFNAGFQHGFQAAYQTRGQEGDTFFLHLNDPIRREQPLEKTRPARMLGQEYSLGDIHRWTNRYYACEEDTFPAKTSRLVVRWLEENCAARPFFLWVDFFDPHEPWDPPEYLVRRYDADYAGPPMIQPHYGRAGDLEPEELHNLWAHYAAEAELVDRMLGRILQKIDDLQLWDDTLLVVTSDHGFSLGEHERMGKSNINPRDDRRWPIYPEVCHVPFLLAGADVPRGGSLDLLAQPMDILPTVCELAGVPVESPLPLHGRSFADAVREGRGTHRDLAVSASYYGPQETLPERAVTPFVVSKRFGYTPAGPDGRPELYDLAVDPLATVNVIDDYPTALREMHDRFLVYLHDHEVDEAQIGLWERHASAAV
jgi:arylsulfatase A-like enzyme